MAWAVTIHKEQGKTEDQLVVSSSGTFHAGQFYTAISRTKEMNGLFILGEINSKKVKVNTKAQEEIKRMKASSSFEPMIPHTAAIDVTMDTFFLIQCFNINSYLPHKQHFERDFLSLPSHATCLVETWLKPTDIIDEIQNYSHLRYDKETNIQHRNGGLMAFLNHSIHLMKHYKARNVETEHMIMLLQPRTDMSLRLCIVLLYHNPKTTTTTNKFLKDLEEIIFQLPQGLRTFILGDFNIDMSLSTSSSAKQLNTLLTYHGFHACIHQSTHRQGGHLDNIFTNVSTTPLIDVIPKYYSDHMYISVAVPWINLI